MNRASVSAVNYLRIRHLKLLEEAVALGSLHKAAAALHVSQPAASAMLQEIEGAFSTISVRDAKGERMNKGESRVDPADHTLLRVPLETLAPGIYTVAWRVVSVDTHVSEGDFVFKVGK